MSFKQYELPNGLLVSETISQAPVEIVTTQSPPQWAIDLTVIVALINAVLWIFFSQRALYWKNLYYGKRAELMDARTDLAKAEQVISDLADLTLAKVDGYFENDDDENTSSEE